MKYNQYRCRRCDVTWRSLVDEKIPDVCWMCESNDQVTLHMQTGKPVVYAEDSNPREAGAEWRQWATETRTEGEMDTLRLQGGES
jgi:hypothetical protein